MRKTKIVCTIGPSSNDLEQIKLLLKSGMNVARLNMSHGSIVLHEEIANRVKTARKSLGLPCAIMVDTCGPEIRIGEFEHGRVCLEKGKTFSFCAKNEIGDENHVFCGNSKLLNVVKPKQKIFANNGLLEFEVKKIEKDNVVCKIVVGGDLSNNKSISVPGVRLPMPFVSKKDEENIRFAAKIGAEYISASFVSNEKDVRTLRQKIKKAGGNQKIISKIESAEGLLNLEKILQESDGIMVARGDLGTEIALERIPFEQKKMIEKSIEAGKIVVVATEMLESMTHCVRPTRAETTDVAQAIYDKTCATMLSGETASGDYPDLCVKTMAKIACETEKNVVYNKQFDSSFTCFGNELASTSFAACACAKSVGAKAIVCFTDGGKTAQIISKFRPQATIVAITHNENAYNSLSLAWGVVPLLLKEEKTLANMVARAQNEVKKLKIAQKGEKIVVTLGVPEEAKGITNSLVVCQV